MDPNSLAEELPALYRVVLARVAELEADGRRVEAARVRANATQIYSRAWDKQALHRLEALLQRNRRPEAGEHVHGGRGGRRSRPRSVATS